MRGSGEKNGISCKVYAGTNTTLLAMDLDDPAMRKGLLGFSIHRARVNGRRAPVSEPLLNLLHFPDSGRRPSHARPSTDSPFQKFRWADYGATPGAIYRYRVDAFYGQPDKPRFLEGPQIEINMHGPSDRHYVVFNRAVVASQAFWRRLPEWLDLPRGTEPPKIKQGDLLPAPAYRWLSRGVEEAISQFIEQANDSKSALDVAIYEYEWPSIAKAVAKAAQAGAHVRLLYHGKPGSKELTENQHTLDTHPVRGPNVELIPRVPSRLMHNKFIVFSKISRGQRSPKAVLAGSTNWTENGLYRQANVVHVGRDTAMAKSYLALFDVLAKTATKSRDTRTWINTNNAIDAAAKFYCSFSPRSGLVDIDEFAATINRAKKDVLFATAFDLHDDIEKALVGDADDPVLRLGIQNKASGIIGAVNRDKTDSFVTPALFGTDADDWFRQRGSAGQRGSLYIHLKAVVTDFTSKSPTVISGSHNLSKSASQSNDENFLIMRGDTDIADVYGLEILRFFDHYRFRHFLKQLKAKKLPAPRNFLVDGDSWADDYYEPGSLHEAERLRFISR